MQKPTGQRQLKQKSLFLCREVRALRLAFLVSSMLACGACTQQTDNEAQTQGTENALYTQSFDFGNILIKIKQNGRQIDKDEVIRGIREALSSKQNNMSKQDIDALIVALNKLIGDSTVASRPVVQPARGGKFVDDYANLNAERPGVIVTASGVQYEVLQAGHGKQPNQNDTVLVNYQGSLSNGVVFDGTDDKPAPLKMSEVVVPGLKEALLLMHEGDKWRVVIPPKMGFVNFGNNRLRRRDLIYEIELVRVESPQ